MVIGIGIDLFDVARMERELREQGAEFRDSLFSAGEVEYCEGKRHPAQHYAARFAAKEAVIKALAADGRAGSFWRDVEIRNEPSGRPVVVLSGRLREAADGLGARAVHVTLSHSQELALAAAIVEG